MPNTLVWRTNKQLADAVRAAREAAGLTQARLADRARVGLKFLYELESGKATLRTDKVLDVLAVLGLRLLVAPAGAAAREPEARYDVAPDYIGMACTSAGVSLREPLSPDELVKALLTGKPTPGKRAHFVVLLEEAPAELLRGLVAQVGQWATPDEVAANLKKIATAVGVRAKPGKWPKTVKYLETRCQCAPIDAIGPILRKRSSADVAHQRHGPPRAFRCAKQDVLDDRRRRRGCDDLKCAP